MAGRGGRLAVWSLASAMGYQILSDSIGPNVRLRPGIPAGKRAGRKPSCQDIRSNIDCGSTTLLVGGNRMIEGAIMVGRIDVGRAELIAEWLSLASDLRSACLSLLPKTQVQSACSLEESPDLFAVLLFCRTITNFKGAISLFQQGLIIEAQTLQRSCFENSLWLRRLANEGMAFAKAISDDGLFNEASFASLVMPSVTDKSTLTHVKGHIDLGKGRKRIDVRGSSTLDGATEDYAEFRRLSMSAAHPSSTSLLRHLVKNTETGDFEIAVEVEEDDQEFVTNLFFTIAAMMHTLNSFVECVSLPDGERIRNEMAARIVALQESSGIVLSA
jgi:hypothetical protein